MREYLHATPCLATITFGPQGGGVAGVSRLLRQVFLDRWGERCRLISLLQDEQSGASLASSTLTRVQFGAQIAWAQAISGSPWTFYTHLSLGKVQAFVPAIWRRPYAVFLHGVEVWGHLTPSQRRVLRGATLRVANSALTARRVADVHPDIGPIVECPLALPRSFGSEDRAGQTDSGWPIGPRAVILVARMLTGERYKGHDELLSAWPAVRARVPEAQLVFVGDGDDVERLKRMAVALGVAEALVFTGFVPEGELDAIYRRAAVFAMPSYGEGFGMVYLEAMAHRLPCIGSIHDAASEVIEDGVTGFLVEQSEESELIGRLVALLSNEGLRLEMGERGYRRLQERFSYEQFSRRILGLIDETLGPIARVERESSPDH
ncbi:MAG: glycosyltransferase family 4 protein [Vicinamibacterales bacterium]